MDKKTIKDITEAKKKLAYMRISHTLQPLKNPREITKQKREIARALTMLNQQQQQPNSNETSAKKQ